MTFSHTCSSKGLKIMNLGESQTADGVAPLLEEADDDAVDPHLVRVKNEAGGDESDEEVLLLSYFLYVGVFLLLSDSLLRVMMLLTLLLCRKMLFSIVCPIT